MCRTVREMYEMLTLQFAVREYSRVRILYGRYFINMW